MADPNPAEEMRWRWPFPTPPDTPATTGRAAPRDPPPERRTSPITQALTPGATVEGANKRALDWLRSMHTGPDRAPESRVTSERAEPFRRNWGGETELKGVPLPAGSRWEKPPGAKQYWRAPHWVESEDAQGRPEQRLVPGEEVMHWPGEEYEETDPQTGEITWRRYAPDDSWFSWWPHRDYSHVPPSQRGILYNIGKSLFGSPITGPQPMAHQVWDEQSGKYVPATPETEGGVGPRSIPVTKDRKTGKIHRTAPDDPRTRSDPSRREDGGRDGRRGLPDGRGIPPEAQQIIGAIINAAGGGRGLPDFMRQMAGNPLGNVLATILRNVPGLTGSIDDGGQRRGDPRGGGDPYSDEGMGPNDDNTYTDPSGQRRTLLPPSGATGGEPPAPSDATADAAPGAAAPGAGPAAPTGAAGAVPTAPAASVAAPGAAPPLPPGPTGGASPNVAPGPSFPGLGNLFRSSDGGAADPAGAGPTLAGAGETIAPAAAGALPAIARARSVQATGEAQVMHAALSQNFGQPFNPQLAAARAPLKAELDRNPALRHRALQIMYNEQTRNPQGVQATAESFFNRALVRKTPLAAQLRWHRGEPNGYYQMGNMGRGMERHLAMLNQALDNAANGSNINNYATDNSSGALARSERSSGRFRYLSGYTGESFFAPGWAEPGFAREWDRWKARMEGSQLRMASQ